MEQTWLRNTSFLKFWLEWPDMSHNINTYLFGCFTDSQSSVTSHNITTQKLMLSLLLHLQMLFV